MNTTNTPDRCEKRLAQRSTARPWILSLQKYASVETSQQSSQQSNEESTNAQIYEWVMKKKCKKRGNYYWGDCSVAQWCTGVFSFSSSQSPLVWPQLLLLLLLSAQIALFMQPLSLSLTHFLSSDILLSSPLPEWMVITYGLLVYWRQQRRTSSTQSLHCFIIRLSFLSIFLLVFSLSPQVL